MDNVRKHEKKCEWGPSDEDACENDVTIGRKYVLIL